MRINRDADWRGVVLAACSGYDPFALLDVLTTVVSIDPDAANLTLLPNSYLPAGQRQARRAAAIEGTATASAPPPVCSAFAVQQRADANPEFVT